MTFALAMASRWFAQRIIIARRSAEILGAIVRSANGVLLLMSKLALDHVSAKTHFVERRRGHRSESREPSRAYDNPYDTSRRA